MKPFLVFVALAICVVALPVQSFGNACPSMVNKTAPGFEQTSLWTWFSNLISPNPSIRNGR